MKLRMLVKRYRWFLIFLVLNTVLIVLFPELGIRSLEITRDNVLEMLAVIPPIFVLLGLMDVWVQRETMMRFMGEGSGLKGGVLAFVLGSAAAGPLYAAFPVAGVMMKKGAKLLNVFIFIGAWSATKIPMLLFEATNLGVGYMLLRLCFNVVGIVVIAVILERSLSEKERTEMYELARNR